ncbi:hypothetical protein ABC382_12490 [Lysinibacillus sp. 1P01SD]|uniref:hypothetical protein n=1 Tax=Lysinibacillus sp. 1P01SD TaxID=3132285 RepID=UPI0039A38834
MYGNSNNLLDAPVLPVAAGATNELVLSFADVNGTETAVSTLTYTPSVLSTEHLTIGEKTISNTLKSSVVLPVLQMVLYSMLLH